MSLTLAIPCRGSIVLAADGKSTDFETGEARPSVTKLFELTDNSAIAITGAGLVDKLDKYMDDLTHTVRGMNHATIDTIAKHSKEIIDRRNWAEYKDDPMASHMTAIVVGYDDTTPKVYAILDNRDMQQVAYCVHGNWRAAVEYLVKNASKNPRENNLKDGNKIAIKMLGKASKANSAEIGKPYSIWHVQQNGIHKLDASDVDKLDKRYNKS